MKEVIRLIGIGMCLVFCGNSEGVISSPQFTPSQVKVSELTKKYEDKLSQSEVFITIPVRNSVRYMHDLRKTLEASVTELIKYGVWVHVIITSDGSQRDYDECSNEFKNFPLSPKVILDIQLQERNEEEISAIIQKKKMESESEWRDLELSSEEQNRAKDLLESFIGLSRTRYNLLERVCELMNKAKKNNLMPFLFMMDSDDIMHKRLILMELLALLETGASTVGPGDFFGWASHIEKWGESSGNYLRFSGESQAVFEIANSDVDEYLIRKDYNIEGCTFNLYSSRIVEKVVSDHNLDRDLYLYTMDPFIDAAGGTNIIKIFLLSSVGGLEYQRTKEAEVENCGLLTAPFFDKQNKQNTLFFYRQHDDSLEGRQRKLTELISTR